MKRVTYYWVDGEYMTPRKARRLHPEGFSTAFSRTKNVPTMGEKLEIVTSQLLKIAVSVALIAVAGYLAFHM